MAGYRGRIGIMEFLTLDADYYRTIMDSNDPVKMRDLAREKGFQTMFMDGLGKAMLGVTTLEEVYRVTST